MSEFKNILQGVKVEWKVLGEVIKLEKGKQLNKEMLSTTGTYPAYNGGIRYSGFTENYNYNENKTIISQGGASAGFVNFIKTKFYANAHCYVVLPYLDKVNNRYIYHVLKHNQNKLTEKQFGAGIPALKTSDILNIPILIPCPDNPAQSLKIQEEIVRILDTLTEETTALTNELTNELKARQMEYAYYREELFRFDKQNTKHLPLGHESIGEFIRGSGLQKKDFTETGIGCIHYGQVYTYYATFATETKSFVSDEFAKNARKAKTGDLVIATTSENDDDVCKAVAWLGISDIAVSSDACFYRHKLKPLYVAYYFQTEQFQSQKRKYITGIKVRRVNANDLAKIQVPVPSKEEQERIVKILDGLDTTTQAITSEIKKEITLRNKQCNHYRDLLLTFPKDID